MPELIRVEGYEDGINYSVSRLISKIVIFISEMNKLNKQYFKTKAAYKANLKRVKEKESLGRKVLISFVFIVISIVLEYLQKSCHERIQENIKNDKSIKVDNDIAP